ncbi:hypothetical protein LC048_10125 [Mesobacillus subterraneus]|uniref:hypothetical protein n=1 Tax=Mesobacillus subterraneus TaxID=285983 RepID=UPI001CFE1469|nr:hypothetical protein [Mesobacillus subterraneus]WLR57178.1 hypothetical protein LC048_10125 [Mesobacillus subterraneus]
MEIEKKHVLKSYKNEQEAIDSIEKIKDEKDSPVNSSASGYNVDQKSTKEYPTNSFSPGELDMGEPAFEDYKDDPTENPVVETHKNKDLDRPLPERAMNNRIR